MFAAIQKMFAAEIGMLELVITNLTLSENDDHANVPVDGPTDRASNLPPELLVMIFGMLDVTGRGRAAQVCINWRDAAYVKSLWRGAKITFRKRYFESQYSSATWYFKRRYSSLMQSLDERGIVRVQSNDDCNHMIKDIFLHMPKLQSLHLGCSSLINHKHVVMDAFRGMPSITELKLLNCEHTSTLWEHIESCCPNLITLHLTSCFTRKDFGENYLLYKGMTSGGLPRLQSLTMVNGLRLTDTWLKSISQNLAQLKSLTLTRGYLITDVGIGYLSGFYPDTYPATSAHPVLDALDLSGCDQLTDVSLDYLSQGQSSLKTIKLSHGLTDAGMEHLSRINMLHDINLDFGDDYCTGLNHLTKMTDLQQLRVKGRTTDLDLAVLGELRITSLFIIISNWVTKQGLNHLARLTHLRALRLTFQGRRLATRHPAMIRECLQHICRLRDLRKLTLDEANVDQEGFDLIAQNLPKLDSFFVKHVNKIKEIRKRRSVLGLENMNFV